MGKVLLRTHLKELLESNILFLLATTRYVYARYWHGQSLVDYAHPFLNKYSREFQTELKHIKLDAELAIGFNFVSEKYISHVLMHTNKSIRAVSRDTTIFETLLTEWKFKPGDEPNTCEINFFIDFKFSNLLYAQVSTIFFDEVVKEMVSAFEKRCEQVGGNT